VKEEIRSVLRDLARLSVPIDSLEDDQDLYKAGMTSHASISVMLALESRFDVEFPDALLRRNVFQSVASIHDAVRALVGAATPSGRPDLDPVQCQEPERSAP
jgi:acyl carrier protein